MVNQPRAASNPMGKMICGRSLYRNSTFSYLCGPEAVSGDFLKLQTAVSLSSHFSDDSADSDAASFTTTCRDAKHHSDRFSIEGEKQVPASL